jgi:hypothetical protein
MPLIGVVRDRVKVLVMTSWSLAGLRRRRRALGEGGWPGGAGVGAVVEHEGRVRRMGWDLVAFGVTVLACPAGFVAHGSVPSTIGQSERPTRLAGPPQP